MTLLSIAPLSFDLDLQALDGLLPPTIGVLVLTNTPNPATNNFWRIHSAP